MWGAAVALLLGAVGCTSGTPAYLPSEDESPEAAIPVVATTAEASPPVVTVRGLDGEPKPRASAETIAPDEAIMATMECEPVSEDTADRIYRLRGHRVEDAVQVEVGEGLEPGEIWWVVAYASDDFREGTALLTTFPSGGSGYRDLGETVEGSPWNRWDNVRWDAERLAKGQSALAKALECIADA